MMKLIKKIEFIESELDHKSYVWRMPKSHLLFLVIRVMGNLNAEKLEDEKKYLYNYLEKVKSFDYYFSNVLLDFRESNFQNDQLTTVLPEDSLLIGNKVGIITNSNVIPNNQRNYFFFTSLDSALSEFSFMNKKKRLDGGGKILEPQDVIKINNSISPYSAEIENIEVELYQLTNLDNSFYLKVFGFYPRGSEGSAEGKFIGNKIKEVMRDFSPTGLIIDFSELDYEWGDDIVIYPWQLKRVEKPLQFVFKKSQLQHFEFVLKKDETRVSFSVTDAVSQLTKNQNINRTSN